MIDTYSKVGFAKLYDSKTPITAAEMLNDRVLPFFESRHHRQPGADRPRHRVLRHIRRAIEYELYLAVENIDHTRTKASSPQTNGICEISAIDRANLVLRIIGKGNKERLVPLPQPILDEFGQLWRTHRNRRWLFPNQPATRRSTQRVLSDTFAAAAAAAGIQRGVTPHCSAAQLCNPADRERRRHPRRADPARPRPHRLHGDLHPSHRRPPGRRCIHCSIG